MRSQTEAFASGVSRLLPFGKRREQIKAFLVCLLKSTSIVATVKMFLWLTRTICADRQVGKVPKTDLANRFTSIYQTIFSQFKINKKTILKFFPLPFTRRQRRRRILFIIFTFLYAICYFIRSE